MNSENPFRLVLLRIVNASWFDRFILIAIILNSLFMAMNDYDFRRDGGERSWRNNLVDFTELWFLAIFTVE
jgi:hypothetical protein